ncbi:hypothetical protein CLOSTASPAR_04618 [[Clostridium] asparagiforme DSM 15981]|uniref:Uncharacterized protein n=1 Tax=[Clostridium] asparagiforme DSM 15981 TaxID=518636 RepID=C0D5S2_9FIRM|nr:hypothetical protein CLOSTASPAR_04618 [[Clostridium] asparagiforme DSM 15981]
MCCFRCRWGRGALRFLNYISSPAARLMISITFPYYTIIFTSPPPSL